MFLDFLSDIHKKLKLNVFKAYGATLNEGLKDSGNDPPTLEELGRDKHLALIMFYSIFPKHVMIGGSSFLLIKTTRRVKKYGGKKSQ